jgi:hypothetical protein
MSEAKKQRKPRRWKGRLAKKIRPQVIRPRGLAVTDAETVARAHKEMDDLYKEAIAREYVEKLAILMKDYGIEEGDFRNLALRLAIDLGIPGFQLDPAPLYLEHGTFGPVMQGKKSGRGIEWTMKKLDDLVSAVEDAKKKHRFSNDRDALLYLAQHQKNWARPAGHELNGWVKTLQNKFVVARKIRRNTAFQLEELKQFLRKKSRKL